MNGDTKTSTTTLSDHIQFLITETASTNPDTARAKEVEKEPPDDFQLVANVPLISPTTFCRVFPFHVMFDRQMRIVQAGKSVMRVIPKVAQINCPLLEVFETVRPHIEMNFQNILSHINTIYVLKTTPGSMKTHETFMRLKVNSVACAFVPNSLLTSVVPGPNVVHCRIGPDTVPMLSQRDEPRRFNQVSTDAPIPSVIKMPTFSRHHHRLSHARQ